MRPSGQRQAGGWRQVSRLTGVRFHQPTQCGSKGVSRLMLQAQRQCPAMRHGGQWRAYPGILRSLQIRRPLLAQQHANRDTANARITTALPNHTLRPKKANRHTYDDTLVHRKSVVSQNFTIFCRLEEHMSFCKKKQCGSMCFCRLLVSARNVCRFSAILRRFCSLSPSSKNANSA